MMMRMGVIMMCLATLGVLLWAVDGAGVGPWVTGHATFYGDMGGGETMQGACGYGNLFDQGYGLNTAALSTALFNHGLTCGACFQLQCINDPQWCKPNANIIITATNFCPPNYAKPNDNGGWCNPPLKHFDLSMPMFVNLVKDYHCGIIPVQFRRVPCTKRGGIRFELKGNQYWMIVLVYNVGGAGDVVGMAVKGSTTRWLEMSRNWGQNWQLPQYLMRQGMSFRLRTSDGRMVQSLNVVPSNWQFGQNFEGNRF